MIVILIVAAIIAIPFILALFTKKNYSIERNIVINRPKQVVFDYIKYLKNQDYYSKWVMMDPTKKKSFRGTDGTIGFVYAWDGNKQAGKGEQEIINIKEGERIDVEIRFERPFAAIAQAPFILEELSENETRLKWGMSSTMNYPMNIILLFMDADKLLGKDLQTSLTTLKGILENN
jgi:hypothetical protein